MFLTLIFIVLVALTFNMYIKRICVIEIFIHFLYNISMTFLRINLGFFIVSCLGVYFFLPLLILLLFLLIFCKLLIYVLLVLMTVTHHHVLLFFHFYINIDKDVDYLQSNNNVFLNDLWLVFPTLVLFLKV